MSVFLLFCERRKALDSDQVDFRYFLLLESNWKSNDERPKGFVKSKLRLIKKKTHTTKKVEKKEELYYIEQKKGGKKN